MNVIDIMLAHDLESMLAKARTFHLQLLLLPANQLIVNQKMNEKIHIDCQTVHTYVSSRHKINTILSRICHQTKRARASCTFTLAKRSREIKMYIFYVWHDRLYFIILIYNRLRIAWHLIQPQCQRN